MHRAHARCCAQEVAEALRENRSIKALNLSRNALGDHGAGEVVAALRESRALRELRATHCALEASGGMFFGYLVMEGALRRRFVSDRVRATVRIRTAPPHPQACRCDHWTSATTASATAAWWRCWTACRRVPRGAMRGYAPRSDARGPSLSRARRPPRIRCARRARATVRIRGAAQVSGALRELSLASCRLTDEAARPLEVALRENKSLKRLNLSGNRLTCTGAALLAKARAAPPLLDLPKNKKQKTNARKRDARNH